MDKRSLPVKAAEIVRLRQAQAWTQRELAKRVGCSKRTIENAELGRLVRLDTIGRLAEVFGANPTDLVAQDAATSPTGLLRVGSGGPTAIAKSRLEDMLATMIRSSGEMASETAMELVGLWRTGNAQGSILANSGTSPDRDTKLDPSQTGNEANKLQKDLMNRIVGQEEAIRQIVSIYQTYLAGMSSPRRPIGNLLFLGPTGTGKTRLVEATAESLAGDVQAVIKVDCAEFQHSHEIAKLIGSPPGYLGHRETQPILSQESLNQFRTDGMSVSFVLFDEIEKASDALWNLLLGILGTGTLTLGDNRKVDFTQTMIFLTSNLGAGEMAALVRPHLGFAKSDGENGRVGEVDESLSGKLARVGVEAARRKFTPEFMNRIDKVVVFRPLGTQQLQKILGLELASLQQRLLCVPAATPFVMNVTERARGFLLIEGTDLKYGARHLKRAIERELVHPLSNLMASHQIQVGDLVTIDFDVEAASLTFTKNSEERPFYAIAEGNDNAVVLAAAATSAPTRRLVAVS